MNKTNPKIIKSQAKKNQIKSEKIYQLQKKVTIIGAAGLVILIATILTGFFVDVNQESSTTYQLKSTNSIKHLITKIFNHPPTILGDLSESKTLNSSGATLKLDDKTFKTVMAARFSTQEIAYTISESTIDVTGTWEIFFIQKPDFIEVKINEISSTNNLGYRAMQFWGAKNRYSNNFFEGIEELAKMD